MRYLVTRPEPDSQRTADKLEAAGHKVDLAPLMVFRALANEEVEFPSASALAITSRRAVEALVERGQIQKVAHLPVFAVGDMTAKACRDAGFTDVVSASGDVAALGATILEHRSVKKIDTVLYVAARDRAGELESFLRARSVACHVVTVYEMNAVTVLPEDVLDALERDCLDGILVYSRRTAEILLSLLKYYGFDHKFSGLNIYAVSQRAAEPLIGNLPVRVAKQPSEEALLDLVLNDC